MLTTHEKIRVEAGYQHEFTRFAITTAQGLGNTTFYINANDPVKIVPNFGTGNTVGGVSDVQVWVGLSGVNGATRWSVNSVDADTGAVTLTTASPTGSSLTVDFASSPIRANRIEDVRLQAESIVNQRLTLCYDLPISPTPSVLSSLAGRLGAALLLIRDYGVGSRSTSKDGYELYQRLMGNQEVSYSDTGIGVLKVGEVGMICTPGYQLVDDSGVPIPRNDEDNTGGGAGYAAGGRKVGRAYDITEEPWRFKPFQADVDRYQPGSADNSVPPVQG